MGQKSSRDTSKLSLLEEVKLASCIPADLADMVIEYASCVAPEESDLLHAKQMINIFPGMQHVMLLAGPYVSWKM